MAQDHLDLCKQAYERFSQGDIDGLLEFFDPEVEVYVAPPNFESGTYNGHDEYRRLLERWGGSWDEMRISVESMEPAGDWILASVEYVGRVKGSELEVRQPSWELSQWVDGHCRRYIVHWDPAQGRAAFQERAATAARG